MMLGYEVVGAFYNLRCNVHGSKIESTRSNLRPCKTPTAQCARAQQYRGGVVKRGNHAALTVYLHLDAAGVYYSWAIAPRGGGVRLAVVRMVTVCGARRGQTRKVRSDFC